jgi:hypothetical protein
MGPGHDPNAKPETALDAQLAAALAGDRHPPHVGAEPPQDASVPVPFVQTADAPDPVLPPVPEAEVPVVPLSSSAPSIMADPVDAILEQEFGIYVQAASAPPPVPAFEE